MQNKKGCGCGSAPLTARPAMAGHERAPTPQNVREFLERRVRVGATHGSPARSRTIDQIVADSFEADRSNVSRVENIRAPGPNGTTLPPLY